MTRDWDITCCEGIIWQVSLIIDSTTWLACVLSALIATDSSVKNFPGTGYIVMKAKTPNKWGVGRKLRNVKYCLTLVEYSKYGRLTANLITTDINVPMSTVGVLSYSFLSSSFFIVTSSRTRRHTQIPCSKTLSSAFQCLDPHVFKDRQIQSMTKDYELQKLQSMAQKACKLLRNKAHQVDACIYSSSLITATLGCWHCLVAMSAMSWWWTCYCALWLPHSTPSCGC